MKNNKKLMVILISTLQVLIVAGLCYAGYYIYNEVSTTAKIADYSSSIKTADAEELLEFYERQLESSNTLAAVDENPFESPSLPIQELEQQMNETLKAGTIEIPRINVSESIFMTTSKATLLSGVGVMKGTMYPSEKPGTSSVLAGHRGLVFNNRMFVDLDQVQVGDEIIVRKKELTLVYVVTGSKTVDIDAVHQIPKDPDKSLLTLVTCTPKMIYSHRLLVFAELSRVIVN